MGSGVREVWHAKEVMGNGGGELVMVPCRGERGSGTEMCVCVDFGLWRLKVLGIHRSRQANCSSKNRVVLIKYEACFDL